MMLLRVFFSLALSFQVNANLLSFTSEVAEEEVAPPPPSHPAVPCNQRQVQLLIIVSKHPELGSLIFPKVGATLGHHFPGAEVAVASYSKKSCFDLLLPFTTNTAAIANLKISDVITEHPPISAALSSLHFATSNPKLLWKPATKHGQDRKIIILFIGGDSSGHDQCSSGATLVEVGAHLALNGFELVLLPEVNLDEASLAEWNYEFVKLGTPFVQQMFDKRGFKLVETGLERVAALPCLEGGELTTWTRIEQSCEAQGDGKSKFQMVIVLDRSSSFQHFFKEFLILAEAMVGELLKRFPDSEVALTSFGDYTHTQTRYGSRKHEDTLYGCFKVEQPFTKDLSTFKKALSAVTTIHGGDLAENSLAAILQSISEPTIGWSKDAKDANGNSVKKLILIVTDAPTHRDIDNGKFHLSIFPRTPPKLDGDDNCLNTKLPAFQPVGKEFKKRDIIPVGFVTGGVFDEWLSYFREMNVPQYILHEFDLDDVSHLVKSIAGVVQTTKGVCGLEMDAPGGNIRGL